MPRTKYHAKLETDRKLKAINTEVTDMTTTDNETNGNGNKAASLNALASALGVSYTPDIPTVEDVLFSTQDQNQDANLAMVSLQNISKVLGNADIKALIDLILNDALVGNGDKISLLKSITTDIKTQEINHQRQAIESQKQQLLTEMSKLDNKLAALGCGTIL